MIEGFKPAESPVLATTSCSLYEGTVSGHPCTLYPRTDDRDNASSAGRLCISECQNIRSDIELEGVSGVSSI